ncbi:hypothetical protein MNBD_PLANCTO02-35 [hydrothermal vent metagenome]|uniref:RNA polymerase sigma-70 region 2 domain-containing protein n=1 Tax=hydrothermal vent metagenome TaxID=652676 RepID=A0A3B1DZ00_9ZZZZ
MFPGSGSHRSERTRLVLQHRTALYSYIFSCVKNHADAEDILHDVCVIAIESFEQLKEKNSFFPWVREIAFRQILAHLKKRKKETPFNPHVVAALADAVHQVEEEQPMQSYREALMVCLDKLPSKSRELIMMRYNNETEEGVTGIATQFGKSKQSIYSRLKRIKSILRNCVAKNIASEATE